jgi:hypothetical protein
LPSVRKKALGKELFADEIFAECSLPSVTLGKAFAECKIAFAECLRHSAKNVIPVVLGAVLGRQVELLLQGLRDIRPLAVDADGARRTDGVGGADAAGVWGGVRQMLVDGVDLMI